MWINFFPFSVDHYEAVQVEFDPQVTDYRNLLTVFWENHDPTFIEKGKTSKVQYRSGIFFHDEGQADIASEDLAKKIARAGLATVRTAVKPAGEFYDAEE